MTPFSAFLDQKPRFQTKIYSSLTHFLVSSYFASHPITVLLKILGGRTHGPSPTSNLGASPSPPKSPPMTAGLPCVEIKPPWLLMFSLIFFKNLFGHNNSFVQHFT